MPRDWILEADLERAIDGAEFVVMAVPSSTMVWPVSFFTVPAWGPGSRDLRVCGTPLKSSAQRAFSVKWEIAKCHRTGADISRV